ncbi:helix-turn-helix domain-containing protein [Pedobacter sp. AW31-3R]|uniref:helix-turn-helix domain-containing protein n=1 Tax=Pedobacter sp. AW31-3R TaxID=3445781 RepID=UPI003FA07AB7
MQFIPSKTLSKVVKSYLILESKTQGTRKLRLFPDGNTGMVFSFKNRLFTGYSTSGEPDYLPEAFIYGQVINFRDILCNNEISLLVIVFHPVGLDQIVALESSELNNRVYDLSFLFGFLGIEITRNLRRMVTVEDRIQVVESFLVNLLADHTFSVQPIVTVSIDLIRRNRGLISVEQLVQYTGYNRRHIERKFIEVVGISPKQYCSIVKLHVFLKFLKTGLYKDRLNYIGHEAGYYDHSHLIKEFKRITGITPTQYMRDYKLLTVNFLEGPLIQPIEVRQSPGQFR